MHSIVNAMNKSVVLVIKTFDKRILPIKYNVVVRDRRVPLPAVSSLPNKELISRTVMAFKECFFPVTCPEDRLAINLVTKVRDILG
ncbi:hypothetical protein TNIN_25841 [Trichonephila inaurata madagascariensis]|uniref:Uncharacterized protein n=1 Tax=Trichonephila inaurata madagascariensis TaxID=2747483 RepID=A0A8X6YIW6_9ARAC|nr:hypothetical protein TNIN_25841 [Trichonephila inaurata madagascariensis]